MSTLARHVSDNLLHLFLICALSFFSSSPHGKRKVFFSLLLFFSVYWRQSCLRGLSLRQHSNQKVALKLTAVPRIAELTLASWCCHITSSCAVKSWFKYQQRSCRTLRKSWAKIWFFILYRSGFTFASNYYVFICPVYVFFIYILICIALAILGEVVMCDYGRIKNRSKGPCSISSTNVS